VGKTVIAGYFAALEERTRCRCARAGSPLGPSPEAPEATVPLPRLAMVAGSTGGWWKAADAEPDRINR